MAVYDDIGLRVCKGNRLSPLVNGHTTLKAPLLVRSAKLSNIGSGQYLDGWPPGNTRCCWHFGVFAWCDAGVAWLVWVCLSLFHTFQHMYVPWTFAGFFAYLCSVSLSLSLSLSLLYFSAHVCTMNNSWMFSNYCVGRLATQTCVLASVLETEIGHWYQKSYLASFLSLQVTNVGKWRLKQHSSTAEFIVAETICIYAHIICSSTSLSMSAHVSLVTG